MSSSVHTFSLQALAEAAGGTLVNSIGQEKVSALSLKSIECKPGTLFFALRGSKNDGHLYIRDACERGAVAAVVESREALQGIPGIVVGDSSRAAGEIAKIFYHVPADLFRVIGITGTNGKTTTNWIVHELLLRLRGGSLRVGTLGARAERIDAGTRASLLDTDCHLTTPDAITLHRYFAESARADIDSAVIEVSAHGLVQERVSGVKFHVGVFTNLTQDHLDYFKDLDDYFSAKKTLFTKRYLDGGVAVINADNDYGARLAEEVSRFGIRVVTFGRLPSSVARIIDESLSAHGLSFTLLVDGVPHRVTSPFIGAHNSENVTAALLAIASLGVPLQNAVTMVVDLPQPRGRLERVHKDGGPAVFVDYAHTPDALERALRSLREVSTGKLWVVFGCGGDRDRKKRPLMGSIADSLADQVIVTSDNPRSEEPSAVIREIEAGMKGRHTTFVDRREAISDAITRAEASDVILIAGKGHEDYQILGTKTIHFSDVEVATEALAGRKNR